MKIVIKGSPKEIAALVTELRKQPKVDTDKFCQSLTSALELTGNDADGQ